MVWTQQQQHQKYIYVTYVHISDIVENSLDFRKDISYQLSYHNVWRVNRELTRYIEHIVRTTVTSTYIALSQRNERRYVEGTRTVYAQFCTQGKQLMEDVSVCTRVRETMCDSRQNTTHGCVIRRITPLA